MKGKIDRKTKIETRSEGRENDKKYMRERAELIKKKID